MKLDACCQYGCDVDLFERDAISLAAPSRSRACCAPSRAGRAVVRRVASPSDDPDVPSGVGRAHRGASAVAACSSRTIARGCAIHRASLEQGWDFRGTKPRSAGCSRCPTSEDAICISDDYHRLLVRLRRGCADALPRRARHDRRAVRRRSRDRDGRRRGADHRAPLPHVDVSVNVVVEIDGNGDAEVGDRIGSYPSVGANRAHGWHF